MARKPRVAIVGAGLGGLAAAIALRRGGSEVTVYEQAPALGEIGAGVNLTPNVLRVLGQFGIEPAVLQKAFRPEHHVFRDWQSGRALFKLRVKGEYERRYGAPVCNVHRADLHEILRSALPAQVIRLNARCTGIARSEGGSAGVAFADGTSAEADLIIGADGIRSVVRRSLFGPDSPRYTGNIAWRFTVPTSSLPAGLVAPDITNWLGPGGHFVHYYVRAGALVNVVAVHETDAWTEESWVLPAERAEVERAYAGWHENILRLISEARACFKWGLFDRDPLRRWSLGRVTLLGDAAHPMLPFLGQGAAMAMEDALTIGLLLAGRGDESIEDLLARYESARIARTARVQLGSRARARENHLRSPLARLRRNLRFRLRQWLRPHATLHAADWIYSYDVARACGAFFPGKGGST